jgi:hypothetical protein
MGEPKELLAAAQRRRDRLAARAAGDDDAKAKAAAARPARQRRARREQVRVALGEAGSAGVVLPQVAGVVALLASALPGFVWMTHAYPDSELMPYLVIPVAVACSSAEYAGTGRALQWARRRQVDRIGRGFDTDAYLDALAENRKRGVLVVRVSFAAPWPDDARASSCDGVLEWMPSLAGVAWDGDVLALRTAELSGRGDTNKYGGGLRAFDNRLFHGALLTIVSDVVPNLEKVAPIASLSAAIDGPVEPWDSRG